MLYSILIYAVEGVFERLPAGEQEAHLARHRELQAKAQAAGKLGPVVKLMGTEAAVTLRQQGSAPMVLDGPFAETKEQLMGIYIVEADSMEHAVEWAQFLPLGIACVEVRPVEWSNSMAAPDADG